ncbi:WD40 repeat domain-containing protein, partial [Streptomyces atratus]
MSDDLNVDGVEAVLAGADGRLADPGFLVNADSEEVLGLVDAASGPAGRLAGAVYRASAHLHRDAGAGVRRQLLALDAARYGDRGLAARITAVPVEGDPPVPWAVEWATSTAINHHSLRYTLTGHTYEVKAVATGMVEGRPVAVTGGGEHDGTVRVWDLATGQPIGIPRYGHTDWAVATAVVDGRPVAVTDARVWDLATGQPAGEPLSGHTDGVGAVATAVLDGRPVAVTASWDKTVRVWDLVTGQPVGEPLSGHTGPVLAVATAVLDGRPVAVTGGGDGTVRVWDLATGQPAGEALTGHTDWVRAVATAVLDGRPVAVTGSDDETVRVWDLATRQPVGEPLTGHTGPVLAVATAVLDGRPVAVTGSWHKEVRVWDLATRQPVGEPLTGHTGPVLAVATAVLDGRPVAVTCNSDKKVRGVGPGHPAADRRTAHRPHQHGSGGGDDGGERAPGRHHRKRGPDGAGMGPDYRPAGRAEAGVPGSGWHGGRFPGRSAGGGLRLRGCGAVPLLTQPRPMRPWGRLTITRGRQFSAYSPAPPRGCYIKSSCLREIFSGDVLCGLISSFEKLE